MSGEVGFQERENKQRASPGQSPSILLEITAWRLLAIKHWQAWLMGGGSKFNTLLDLVLQWQNGAYTNACIRPVQESEGQKRRINHDTGFASHFISHHRRRIGEFPDHGYVPRTTTCIDCRRLCAGRKVYELQHGAARAAHRSAADVDRGRSVLVSRRD